MPHPSRAGRPSLRSPRSWGEAAARARLAPIRAELGLMRALRLEQEQEQELTEANGWGHGEAPAHRRATTRQPTIRASLQDIDAALERIDQGSYGTCVACAEQIAASRLIALPETAMCGRCAKRSRSAGASR